MTMPMCVTFPLPAAALTGLMRRLSMLVMVLAMAAFMLCGGRLCSAAALMFLGGFMMMTAFVIGHLFIPVQGYLYSFGEYIYNSQFKIRYILKLVLHHDFTITRNENLRLSPPLI